MKYHYYGLIIVTMGYCWQTYCMERDVCKVALPTETKARAEFIKNVVRPIIATSITEQMYKDSVAFTDKIIKVTGTAAQKALCFNTYTPKSELVKSNVYTQEAQNINWHLFSTPPLCEPDQGRWDEERWNNFIDNIKKAVDYNEHNELVLTQVHCIGQDFSNSLIYENCLIKSKRLAQAKWPYCAYGDSLLTKVLKNILISLQGINLELQKFSNPYDPWELLEIIQQELRRAKIIEEKVDLIYLAYYFYPEINTLGSRESIQAFVDKHCQNDNNLCHALWYKLLLVGAETDKDPVYKLLMWSTGPQEYENFVALDKHILWATEQTLCARYNTLYSLDTIDHRFINDDIDHIGYRFLDTDKKTMLALCGIYDLLLYAIRFNSTTIVKLFIAILVHNPAISTYWNDTPCRARFVLRQLLTHSIRNDNFNIVCALLRNITPGKPWDMYRDIITEDKLSHINSTSLYKIAPNAATSCRELQIPNPLISSPVNKSYMFCIQHLLKYGYSEILATNDIIPKKLATYIEESYQSDSETADKYFGGYSFWVDIAYNNNNNESGSFFPRFLKKTSFYDASKKYFHDFPLVRYLMSAIKEYPNDINLKILLGKIKDNLFPI
ncbi:hypothetical protein J120_02700 [candidate division TM6 bacterium JCVI TM6SC1]|uniref:Uncharacterized protein n=1 Tax=candidate division TM6 bacterium JCVI TM6SC1 TaxID=1306947 RepID=A0A0D2K4T2_9BACT|nr:hypothetical protein J120_02700 [candidate division TM6 bacterium JCVI TM6SC1]